MNRRGVALVAVLWMVVAATVVAAGAVEAARGLAGTTRNRIAAARAAWARDACVAILVASWEADTTRTMVDEVNLNDETRCQASLVPSHDGVNPNFADSATLARVLGSDILASRLLDWLDADTVPRAGGAEAAWYRERDRRLPRNGPLASVDELSLIDGFESLPVAGLRRTFTVAGDGSISLMTASREGLAAALGDQELAEAIVAVRSLGPAALPEDLGARLPPPLQDRFGRFLGSGGPRFSMVADWRELRSIGRVAGWAGQAVAVLDVRMVGGRLAILRRAVD